MPFYSTNNRILNLHQIPYKYFDDLHVKWFNEESFSLLHKNASVCEAVNERQRPEFECTDAWLARIIWNIFRPK